MERTSHRGFSRGANNVKQRGSGGKRGVFTIFQNLSTSKLLFFFFVLRKYDGSEGGVSWEGLGEGRVC